MRPYSDLPPLAPVPHGLRTLDPVALPSSDLLPLAPMPTLNIAHSSVRDPPRPNLLLLPHFSPSPPPIMANDFIFLIFSAHSGFYSSQPNQSLIRAGPIGLGLGSDLGQA